MNLEKIAYRQIADWVHRNARHLELAVWRCLFEGGKKADVVAALRYYQNPDGGFGRAIEPDNWNTNSTPYSTLYALKVLRQIGFADRRHPLYRGIFDYLSNRADFSADDGWSFSVPSNDAWPHAPWWGYSPERNKAENIGLTAEVCAFILKDGEVRSPLYETATAVAQNLFTKLQKQNEFGDMGIGGFCALIEAARGMKLVSDSEWFSLEARVRALVNGAIERDVSKWSAYGVRPSNYIESPASPYLADNREILELELDYLVETLPEDGVWGITWSWFDLTERFPKEFAISENWWKSIRAIEFVSLLRAFGRIAT